MIRITNTIVMILTSLHKGKYGAEKNGNKNLHVDVLIDESCDMEYQSSVMTRFI